MDPGSGIAPWSSGGLEDIAVPGKVHGKPVRRYFFNLRGFLSPCKGLVVRRQQSKANLRVWRYGPCEFGSESPGMSEDCHSAGKSVIFKFIGFFPGPFFFCGPGTVTAEYDSVEITKEGTLPLKHQRSSE